MDCDGLRGNEPVGIICEPSGGYERDMLEALWAAGLAVSLVHAARVRAFARAQGLLAKTDPIDAVVLREFGELLQPGTLAAPSPQRERLAALVQRREQLVKLLSTEVQRLAQTRDAEVRKLGRHLLKTLEKQVEQLALTAVMRKLVVLLNHLLKNPDFKLA